MIEGTTFTVEQGGIRLDAALLSRFPSSTRAFCRAACATGEVLVDGKSAIKGLKLRGGESIHIRRLAEASDNRVAPNPAVQVRCLFEDEALLAFNKFPGQPVQPLTYRETGTLMNGVVARWPDVRDVGDQPLMAGALHRIDADTSGLVLVARTPAAFDVLRAQFAAQTVKKTYLALVEGSVAVGGTLENDLVHDPTLPAQRPTEQPSAVTPTKSPIISQTEQPASPTAEPIIPQTDPIEPIEVEPTTGRPRSDLASVGLMIPIGSYSGSDEIFCRLSDSSGREIGSKDLFDESHRVYFTTGSGYLLLSYPLSVVDEPLPPGNYTMIFYDADGNDFYISTVYLSKGSR